MEGAAVSMAGSWCRPMQQQQQEGRMMNLMRMSRSRSSARVSAVVRTRCATAARNGGGVDDFTENARRTARAVADKAQELFNEAKQRAVEFEEENDLEGKLRRFSRGANQRIEEAGYEMKRNASRLNRKYNLSEKAHEFVDYVKDRAQAADSRFRIRQQARALSMDVRMKLPAYRRQLSNFLDTPLGKLVSTILFAWFVLSGWIFRVLVLSMWLLPIAAPLLIGTIARNAIVEGTCPNCKAQFIGSRSQVVVCRSCRNVVWQPRDDFSSSSSSSSRSEEDPSIIDIDVDKD